MLSEVFWVGFYTTGVACLLGMVKMIYKSKCSSVDMCCLRIVRDTSGELREDELELEKREGGEVKV